jgi:hypothetical protein
LRAGADVVGDLVPVLEAVARQRDSEVNGRAHARSRLRLRLPCRGERASDEIEDRRPDVASGTQLACLRPRFTVHGRGMPQAPDLLSDEGQEWREQLDQRFLADVEGAARRQRGSLAHLAVEAVLD